MCVFGGENIILSGMQLTFLHFTTNDISYLCLYLLSFILSLIGFFLMETDHLRSDSAYTLWAAALSLTIIDMCIVGLALGS